MAYVYLGLGANLGDKNLNLNTAIQHISLQIGSVLNVSSFYRSKAWGFESENDFLNAVILVDTLFTPFQLLAKTQEIQKKMGRSERATGSYADRIIDIDILLYDNRIINMPELIIPHPHIEKRDFVLVPLSEIAPELIHPVRLKTMKELTNIFINTTMEEKKNDGYVSKKHNCATKRYCQTMDLRDNPELIAEYKKRHGRGEVWDEILQGIKEIGILEMEIYLLGTRLFMVVETPENFAWDAAFKTLNELPRQKEWEDFMAIFQNTQPGASSAEKWRMMERIFYLYE